MDTKLKRVLRRRARVTLCARLCASAYLSRPYVTLPMKGRDFCPFTPGYLACWNAASITLVVFSFTARSARPQEQKQTRLSTRAEERSAKIHFKQPEQSNHVMLLDFILVFDTDAGLAL